MSQMIKRIDAAFGGKMRRVEILAREDGCFQFLERIWQAPDWDAPSAADWPNLHRSGLYQTLDEAEREARRFIAAKRPDRFRD
jgi:hypothetical protein